MDREKITLKLCDIIKNVLEENDCEQGPVSGIQTLSELGVNSVQFISIIVQSEMEFDIEFDDELLDADKFSSIDSIIDYIEQKRD